MNTKPLVSRFRWFFCLIVLVLSVMVLPSARSAPIPSAVVEAEQAIQSLNSVTGGTAEITLGRATGVARFARFPENSPPLAIRSADAQAIAEQFLVEYGAAFGVRDPARELRFGGESADFLSHTQITYQQIYQNLPVYGARLHVHLSPERQVKAVNGLFVPDIEIATEADISAETAQAIARQAVQKQSADFVMLQTTETELLLYHIGLIQDIPGAVHLAYKTTVSDGHLILRDLIIDANDGTVLNNIERVPQLLQRRIYNGAFFDANLIWQEGDALPQGTVSADRLIQTTEDAYNFFSAMTGGTFLSWDGVSGVMIGVDNNTSLECPNAQWDGTAVHFCPGTTADDVIAHEWGHAYTQSHSDLIYQWQAGALNESFSDIWGETVDLLNGHGTDTPNNIRVDDSCVTVSSGTSSSMSISAPAAIAGNYEATGATFNPESPREVSGEVVLVNDGSASPTLACSPVINSAEINGKIALIDRGDCTFVEKVNNAAAAGAIGVVVANNVQDPLITMTGDTVTTIPVILISLADGQLLRQQPTPPQVTINSGSFSSYNNVRWLIGEDAPAFAGALRDMWSPTCYDNPDQVAAGGFYDCSELDNGGVHTNSGVPNHLYALLVDGGSYNGINVGALGLTKAAQIHWRDQTTYLDKFSGFSDHANGLKQACQDLIGQPLFDLSDGSVSAEVISSADCEQLQNGIDAVKLEASVDFCGFAPLLDPTPIAPLSCSTGTLSSPLTQSFENGLGKWEVGTRNVANAGTFDTPDWATVSQLPDGRAGSAAFVLDSADLGDCQLDDESGVLYLQTPLTQLPATFTEPYLTFTHWFATESLYDGGNVKININQTGWTLVPKSAFVYNGYPSAFDSANNTSPLAGEEAFTGTNGGSFNGIWAQSRIDLAKAGVKAGDKVQIRFEMGLDGCNGVRGWYVDDVDLSICSVQSPTAVTLDSAESTHRNYPFITLLLSLLSAMGLMMLAFRRRAKN